MYSLYFCREYSKYLNGSDTFNFNIQTNVPDLYKDSYGKYPHPNNGVIISEGAAKSILPLLEAQSYINKVSISNKVPKGAYNLAEFRTKRINMHSSDIRRWYYVLLKENEHLPAEFWKKIITSPVKDKLFKDKIILALTTRYHNPLLDLSVLNEFKDSLVFFGLPYEYKLFTELTKIDIPYQFTSNFLEASRIYGWS